MKYNPELHTRQSIRLKNYHYSCSGGYFVTIVARNRECNFGIIDTTEMMVNDAGRMVRSIWNELPEHYPGVDIDAFQIMPNHIHGIILLTNNNHAITPTKSVEAGPCACPDRIKPPYNEQTQDNVGQPRHPNGQPRGVAPTAISKPLSLPDVVHRFKTLATKLYIDGVKKNNWPPFPGKLWQRNYFEHIIRNEYDLNRIREYIINNPSQWENDIENPTCP